jgi:Retinal pigment epithelial membrane protein
VATKLAPSTKGYNNFFVTEKDLKNVPPYFRDTTETPEEVRCEVKGTWPKWLKGTFLR